MQSYLVKIIFQIICGNGNHMPQFDEQLRLITAEDEPGALVKARKIGEREQESFFNEERRLVQWKFIDVTDLFNLSGQPEGAEISSRIEEYDQAGAYIELVHRKAAQLEGALSQKTMQLI